MKKSNYEELEKLNQWDLIHEDYIETKIVDYSYYIWEFLIRFSELEHEINISIANLITERSHDKWYSIIEWLSFSSKLDMYNRLSKWYISISDNKSISEKFKNIVKDIKKLSEFRNILAHSNWSSMKKWWFVRVKFYSDKEDWFVTFKYIKILPRNIKSKITKVENIIEKLYWINEKITGL